MRFFNGGIKDGFEEGFEIGFDVWGDHGNNPRRKVEACARVNSFNIGVKGGSDNVI